MKIAVIGSGAMGSLFGTRLALSGQDVTMVDVNQSIIDIINRQGMVLIDDDGEYAVPMKAARAEQLKDAVDLVILLTKSMYSRAALEKALGFIGPETYVITFQNGLGNMELINEFVPLDRILVGTTTMASTLLAPGRISAVGRGISKFRAADGSAYPIVTELCRILTEAKLGGTIAPDVFVAIWEKAGFNAAINCTTAICRTSCGAIALTPEGRSLAFQIAREVAMVANAHGVPASAEAIEASLAVTFEIHKNHVTSMAQDIIAHRRTEIMAINGEIIKKAQDVGLSVPRIETLYALVRMIEDTYDFQITNSAG